MVSYSPADKTRKSPKSLTLSRFAVLKHKGKTRKCSKSSNLHRELFSSQYQI